MKSKNASGAQTTADVFAFNYVEVTSVDTLKLYHCTSEAVSNAGAEEAKWQIVRETLATNEMAHILVGSDCVPDFAHKINTVAGLAGADVYLDSLTYWAP